MPERSGLRLTRDGPTVAVCAVALLLLGAAAPAFHATAPPVGHTGGFGEPTCAVCHTGDPLNALGGSVHVEGLPARYRPGTTYPLTVVLRADETAIAGFQLAARFSGGGDGGRPAGSLRPLDERVAVTFDDWGRPYAHQTEAGAVVVDAGESSWTLEWVAPPGGGEVTFHVAANSGNGDRSPLGDLIYAAEARVGGGAQRPPP